MANEIRYRLSKTEHAVCPRCVWMSGANAGPDCSPRRGLERRCRDPLCEKRQASVKPSARGLASECGRGLPNPRRKRSFRVDAGESAGSSSRNCRQTRCGQSLDQFRKRARPPGSNSRPAFTAPAAAWLPARTGCAPRRTAGTALWNCCQLRRRRLAAEQVAVQLGEIPAALVAHAVEVLAAAQDVGLDVLRRPAGLQVGLPRGEFLRRRVAQQVLAVPLVDLVELRRRVRLPGVARRLLAPGFTSVTCSGACRAQRLHRRSRVALCSTICPRSTSHASTAYLWSG